MEHLIKAGDACKIHCCGKTYNANQDYTPKSRVFRCDGVWHIEGPCFPCIMRGGLADDLRKAGIIVTKFE